MAGGDGHLVEVARVPGGDDQATADGVGRVELEAFDPPEKLINLVDRPSVGGLPRSPLPAVDGSEFAIGVGPFVPDRNAVLLQVGDVRRTPEEPDQLMHDRPEREPLRRDRRESPSQIVPGLPPEDAQGVDLPAGRRQDGAGRLADPMVPHVVK